MKHDINIYKEAKSLISMIYEELEQCNYIDKADKIIISCDDDMNNEIKFRREKSENEDDFLNIIEEAIAFKLKHAESLEKELLELLGAENANND